MEKENLSLLELIPAPGFCVRENRIIKANLEAKKLSLTELRNRECADGAKLLYLQAPK